MYMIRERVLRWVDRFVRLPTVGFDISDLSVKYLEFIPHGDKISVGHFGELVLPEGLVVGGEIFRVEELAKLFKEWTGGTQASKILDLKTRAIL